MNTTIKTDMQIKTLTEGLAFPEGPAFGPDGSLWAVELKGGRLVQYKNGSLVCHHVGGAPNGIAIDGEGMIWFCDAGNNAIRTFNPVTKESTTVVKSVDGEPLAKPNDLAFDAAGNLLFTCPGNSRQQPTGYACVLMKNGTVKKFTTGKYFPNGLAFTADGKELILVETYKHRLWKGAWDVENGGWMAEEVWCHVGGPDGPGGPDGMAFNNDGNLYVAVYGTGQIRVVNPTGEVIQKIVLPANNPTNCAFDPSGTLGLVITEAEKGLLLSIPLNEIGRINQPLINHLNNA